MFFVVYLKPALSLSLSLSLSPFVCFDTFYTFAICSESGMRPGKFLNQSFHSLLNPASAVQYG